MKGAWILLEKPAPFFSQANPFLSMGLRWLICLKKKGYPVASGMEGLLPLQLFHPRLGEESSLISVPAFGSVTSGSGFLILKMHRLPQSTFGKEC